MQEDSWAYYARLRTRADSGVLNDTYWANDEALEEILDRISAGQPMPTEQQLDDLIGNRRRKLRQRRQTFGHHLPVALEDGSNVEPASGVQIDIVAALMPLSEREREIIVGLAIGQTHGEVAALMKRPIGSIKVWAHRARQKMAA
jgi:DNA-binding NarL/FixJ family response regulator